MYSIVTQWASPLCGLSVSSVSFVVHAVIVSDGSPMSHAMLKAMDEFGVLQGFQANMEGV